MALRLLLTYPGSTDRRDRMHVSRGSHLALAASLALCLVVLNVEAQSPSPDRTNSVATQSSSSGWLGRSPCDPKSSSVFTKPVAK